MHFCEWSRLRIAAIRFMGSKRRQLSEAEGARYTPHSGKVAMLVAVSGALQGKWFPEAEFTSALTKALSFVVVLVTTRRMMPHFVRVNLSRVYRLLLALLPRANVLLFMDRFRNIVFKEPTFDQHVCL
jgi:hypothetical protein